jgi:hypothetical protein
MTQKTLAARYKSQFSGNTQGITNLAASVKRTGTALDKIQAEFHVVGQLTDKDRSTLLDAIKVLRKLGSSADLAKSDVKRHAAEKQKLQERLIRESTEAVNAGFSVEQVEDAVAFLAWEHKLTRYASYNWRNNLKEEMAFDSWRHRYRQPDVMREIRSHVNDLVREMISSVAAEATVKSRPVGEIVVEALADFNNKRPMIQERQKQFIQEIKAAAVSQALDKVTGDGNKTGTDSGGHLRKIRENPGTIREQ